MAILKSYEKVSNSICWYEIPFDEMSAEVSEEVVLLLQGNWILFRRINGNYILKSFNKDKKSLVVSDYEDLVESICRKYHINSYYLTSVSTVKYYSNALVQKLIDAILKLGYEGKNKVKGVCLGFTMKDSKTFCLAEVLEEELNG